ncbi:MAG TPA: cytochrome o ubiquinol oxidase subunit IV [Candidatus Paceibacterota bacterium]|nr:cytochrome o ubiquinol oxidase subunit IV [Candidatus Paceibacterota bacterium]
MANHPTSLNTDKHHAHLHRGVHRGPLEAYTLGFLLSILFTATAFFLTVEHAFPVSLLIALLMLLALSQFAIQLLCFLHLSREVKPRWHIFVFAVMTAAVLIIVIGSLWIMHNLNTRMMPSAKDMTAYMQSQTGI